MPLTKITSSEISTGAVTADKIANNVTLGGPKITTVNVANSAYTVLDDTAVNIGGGYIVITGSGFESGAQVIIDTTTATSVAYVNNTTLRAEVPSKSAASYNLYVVNPDGGTAIRVNGLTYSANPTWVTASPLANWAVNIANNTTFNATGATTYSNTTALPAGTQLLSNGYFYGTVTGISVETQYTFTVRATDAENQESDKSFSVTVTIPADRLYFWGRSYNGEGLLPADTYRSSPTQINSGTNWKTLDDSFSRHIVFSSAILGLKSNGELWSWGTGSLGALGLNDIINRSSPVQVGSNTDWDKLGGNQRTVFGIKTNGSMWAWGDNGFSSYGGTLGLNDQIKRSSPVQVGSSTDWAMAASGTYHTLALKTDGSLWTWGQGADSGRNTSVASSSPSKLGTDNWSIVTASGYASLAIRSDGTLWSWGRAFDGLGLNAGTAKSSPTQVGASTNWSKIHTNGSTTVAIKTDGTLWTWGTNFYGQLGHNDRTYRSSPTQVGSDINWSKAITGGFGHTVAIKTDGTLWYFGFGRYADGNNTSVTRSSPVQIGTETTWKNVYPTYFGVLAIGQ